MITRDELLYQAEAFDLNHADIQRDYVFGWIISGIFRESTLADNTVLKGGNALRKGYLPGTRFSDDLDFSSPMALDPDSVLTQLNRVCEFAAASSGIPFDIARNRQTGQQQIDGNKQAYKYRLYFKDMIGGSDHVTVSLRVDMTEFDQLYLPVQERDLIHPYSDAADCAAKIRCVALEEALADKMKCLLQRRYCYDIFDLVYGAFISKDIPVDRSTLMNVFLRKTIFGASPIAAKSLLLDLPLDLFRAYWGKVLVPAASRLSFDDAIQAMRAGIEDLFSPYGGGPRSELAFYPSHLRNIILEAGSEQKLLRLTYDGVARIVEPYSLQFKRAQNGAANEYLYVYDRTGGRSSGPGIKSLFHYKIQNLQIVDEHFEPRFEVGLSKAGDSSQGGYFSGTSGRRSTGIRRARVAKTTNYGPTYIIGCSACGKQFRRNTSSTQLNAHKTTYGTPCRNRRGYLVRIV